ncbi:MAG: ABC transporter ATP-binding protein [bacterium]|nr:ABC transporter ATP-binding protein [bacterium]
MHLLWNYIKQYKSILFGALALATINQGFSLLDPQIFRLIVDRYATRVATLPQDEFLHGVILLLLAAVGVAFVSRVAKNFQDYYVNVITQRLGTRLYADGIAHAFSLPYAVFEDQRSGELLRQLQKARDDVQKLIVSAINILFLSFVGVIFVLIYAFFVHWLVGLVYFLIIPLLGAATYFIGRRIKTIQKNIVVQTGELAGSTTETLRNVELVKSLGLEAQEVGRLNAVNDQILQLELYKVRLIRKLNFTQGTLINALRSSLMLLMLWLIFNGDITLGEFFSLLFYSFFIFNPLGELGNVSAQYQEARGSMEVLGKVLATLPAPKPARPIAIEGAIRDIAYENVTFQYASADKPSLSGVSFRVKGGTTIAFVGPSGSGKTTVMKLLSGLYQPTDGKIFFNGVDSSVVDFDAVRLKMGLVSQDTQLFAGTIRENLLFVRPDATDKGCEEALDAAAARTIIERGNKGLDTRIGESGIKLSGGEKQRLAIARALLRKPHVLVFDEATSSLDSITEKSITETIKKVTASRQNLITVLVAHRLSTIMHADTIYVLEKGKIVESGSHEALLREGGLYAALWREQSASTENGINS